jgi:hypothetical protein
MLASGGAPGNLSRMKRILDFGTALVLGAAFWLGAFGSAQAQQRTGDPFGGQFGVMQVAQPPREAAHQAQLLHTALAGLAPQRPGQQDVYVLAAAFWGEPVFESEARQAEAQLRQRLHADGRSILLTMGAGPGARAYPAATPDNFAAALGQIGATIDPNEDLVVLFLTSHGASDGSIVIQDPARARGVLRPANLRDALADAGIRNRVVIVSACFSGAFIAPLMSDTTIVLAAAAYNRSSFGCQPQREWTYFGDAFFAQSWRPGVSMLTAFDRSKTLIEQWERRDNLTPPSNPQRFVGSRAADMLARAER